MRFTVAKTVLMLSTVAALGLGACSSDDDEKKPLAGERISVLDLEKTLMPDAADLQDGGFAAPEPWANDVWPQNGGYPNHAMQSLALNEGELHKAWSADIGSGAQASIPLVTQPIVVGGRVFTIDTESELAAFSITDGKRLWKQEIAPRSERKDPIIAGGIAFSQDRLYVTNGFNEVLSIDPADGRIMWRRPLPGPSRAAPTVQDGRVFVVTLDNQLMAYSITDGSLLWQFTGMSEVTGLIGGASPAASRDVVIPALSSGEILALRVENGAVSWSDNLSTTRKLGNLASLADIRGLPVMDQGLIFAISYGGKMVAIDERTGTRAWQRDIGGTETPWIAGNRLFLITSNNELVSLGRSNGAIDWVLPLAKYENEKKKKDPILWTGPVMAGKRLIIAGSDGTMMEVDPVTGHIVRKWDARGAVTISPVVAGGVLYVLSDDGTLTAYK